MHSFRKTMAVLAVGLMAGFGMSGCSSSSSNAPAAPVATITGTVANGPISGGTVTVTNAAGGAVATTPAVVTTNGTGQYSFSVPAGTAGPLTITVSNGVNVVSTKANEFTLVGKTPAGALAGNTTYVANATLFSTLENAGLANAATKYAFGNDPAACNPNTTNLTTNAACAASILRANEALAQMIRMVAADTYAQLGAATPSAATLATVVARLAAPGSSAVVDTYAGMEQLVILANLLNGQMPLMSSIVPVNGAFPMIANGLAALNPIVAALYPGTAVQPTTAPMSAAASLLANSQANAAVTATGIVGLNVNPAIVALLAALPTGGATVTVPALSNTQQGAVYAAVFPAGAAAGVPLSGNGQKGPIKFGAVTATDAGGNKLTTTTDAYGNYTISVPTTWTAPITVTIANGIDTVTNLPQEMPLSVIINTPVANLSLANANATPMTSMIAAAAQAAASAGVPLAQALTSATTSVVNTMGFGLSSACLTADVTTDPYCASQMLRANEAVGQMMRDTALNVAGTGNVSSGTLQTVMAALAADVAYSVAVANNVVATPASLNAAAATAVNTVNASAGTGQTVAPLNPVQSASVVSAAATNTVAVVNAIATNTLAITPLPSVPTPAATVQNNPIPAATVSASMTTSVQNINPTAAPPATAPINSAAINTVLQAASTNAADAYAQVAALVADPTYGAAATASTANLQTATTNTQTASTAMQSAVTQASAGGTTTAPGSAAVTTAVTNNNVTAAVTTANNSTQVATTTVVTQTPVVVPAPTYPGFGINSISFAAASAIDVYGVVANATSPYNNVAVTFSLWDRSGAGGTTFGPNATTYPITLSFDVYTGAGPNLQFVRGSVSATLTTNGAGNVTMVVDKYATMTATSNLGITATWTNLRVNPVFTNAPVGGALTINLTQWLATADTMLGLGNLDIFKANPRGTVFNYEMGLNGANFGLYNAATGSLSGFFPQGSANVNSAKNSVHGQLTTQ